MISTKRCKCKNCHTLFLPDPRNVNRQKFCSKPTCRKASKTTSQAKWLKKLENQDYFRSAENVKRVQLWRKNHPKYWRRKPSWDQSALQDPSMPQHAESKEDNHKLPSTALQDLLIAQPFVLLGLIANLTDITLQDNIDTTLRRLQQLGRDIANHHMNRNKGGLYGFKKSYPAPTTTACAPAVQLGRPAAGP